MIAMSVAMGIGRFVYTPLLPELMDGLHLSPSDAGLIASANYVGYLLGAILAAYGWAAGRERNMFLAGLVAMTLLLAAMPFAGGVWALSIIRFAAGIASAFVMIFSSTIIFGHFDKAGRGGLQALHFGGVGLGIAVSAILLLVLIATQAHWTAGWYASAIMAFVGSIAAAILVRADPVRSANGHREPPLNWDRPLVLITVAYGLFGAGYIVTATFLVAIVRGGHEQSVLEGWVWLAAGIAAGPSVLFWAPLHRRFGLIATFAIGCLVEAFGVSASVLMPLPFGPFIGGVLLGGTFVAVTALGLNIGRMLAPQSQRRVFASMTAAFGTGQIVGPVVAGYLADLSGSYTSGSLVAALALVVSALLAIMARAHEPGTQN
ncbi:MAG: MFS transporter [Hyphomicrobiales bacterium]|nr:MFS transporter [Hyphomicrobiales bacterium]MCP4997522.1 MFS transporter [Hyphomicrobiales bacterium]